MFKFLCCAAMMLCFSSIDAKRSSIESDGTKKTSKRLVNAESDIIVKEDATEATIVEAAPSADQVAKKPGFWHGVRSKIGSWFAWGSKKKENEADAKVLAKQKAQEREAKDYAQEKKAKESRADHSKDVLDHAQQDVDLAKKEVKNKKKAKASVNAKAERVVEESRDAERKLQEAKDSDASPEEIQRLQSKAKKAFSKRMDSEKEQKAAENRKLAADGRKADKKDALGRAKKEERKTKKALKKFNQEKVDPTAE